MVRLIKNVPRNTVPALGNRGAGFPLSPVDCFYKIPPPECILVLEEEGSISILQESQKQIGIYCPPAKPPECYIAMQEDGGTILELPYGTETKYASVSCLPVIDDEFLVMQEDGRTSLRTETIIIQNDGELILTEEN